MKSLWLAVLVLCVIEVKAEDSGVSDHELVMRALKTIQSNIHALERALIIKVDEIVIEQSKLTEKLADNMRTTALQMDKLGDGIQSNNQAMESGLKFVVTKVDQLMADHHLSKMTTNVDSVMTEQSNLSENISDHSRTAASQTDKLVTVVQSNGQSFENSLKSVITKVDQLIADQRLSKIATKVDNIMTEQSILSEKISNHSRTAVSQTDKLMTGIETNGRTLENSLKSVMTKVDRLIGDQRLSTISTKVDRIIKIINMTIDDESRCPKNKNGVHLLRLPNGSPFQVYCRNGWIVIQSRINGNLSFNRNWNEYRNGFGDFNGDHWLGLEKMHRITREGSYELMVVLRDYGGVEKTAKYTGFEIASEGGFFRLDFKEFSNGNAGDSLTRHKGMPFATPDRGYNYLSTNCAKGSASGWWFNSCYHANLNGQRGAAGIVWKDFNEYKGLNQTMMMIRQIN